MAAGIAALEELGTTLTPTLSRPTGEGESSHAAEKRRAHEKSPRRAERASLSHPMGEGEGEGEGKSGDSKPETRNPKPDPSAYARLERLGAQLEAGMRDAAKSAGVPVQFNRCGSMFCAYFTGQAVHNLADAMKSDRERFKKYFHGMLAEGIYLAPSQFEAGFISTAHSQTDIDRTVKAAARVLKQL
jgi:hypothetical protein